MTNRIMWRIDDNDTLVIFPENGITGESKGYNTRNHEFDIYNAETNKREDLPSYNPEIKYVKTEGKLVFYGSLRGMFYCSSAKEIDLSSFDTSNVTDISYMFAHSQVLRLDLFSFDTSKVTNMRSMFTSCSVAHLDLSNFDTSNVTDMAYMFSGSDVNSLDLSSFNTRNVANMYFMFYSSLIKKLDLSSFIISDKTDTTGMFRDTPNTTVLVNEEIAKFIEGDN